jgi:hypothetical protein
MDKAAKANEAAITEKLLEWGKLEKKRLAIEAQLEIDCAPYNATRDKATSKFVTAASVELSSLVPQLASLNAEIVADLEAGCDAETGIVQLPQVTATLGKATAVAQVTSKPGARVINVGKFFSLCLAAKRLSIFFSSITVGVSKAKEAFGDHEVDKVATKTTNHAFELKLTV